MHTTSISLLERLRRLEERSAWERFVELYTPLLYFWTCRLGMTEADAADLVQEVFAVLVEKLPAFQYDAGRSFRAWLRTITYNKWRDFQRRRAADPTRGGSEALADVPASDSLDNFWDQEYRQHLVGRALELMKSEFQPSTWKACWECVVSDRPAAEVAVELGLSVEAVYAAKSRVLRRLRQELSGLLG
ncbi:MAG TPA: sigma-70 family RNA polymerase sigma factor [Gemmataceae bacterium]|jgi:RNA polymerase sigma-70 factor (ECF subfamily)